MPAEFRSNFPQSIVITISIILLLIGIVGRFVNQYLDSTNTKKTEKNVSDTKELPSISTDK